MMKKILFVVAILLIANPTWAGLTITAVQTDDCNEVTISYDMEDTDPNLPRAFALEISLDNDANIGPVTYVNPDFHVYPGSIVITGGVVTNQGTPVAESDVSSMIVEMGSLYATEDPCHTSPPAENGVLLVFMVQNNVDCNVILAQNAIRGGVVMEDTGQEFSPSYVTFVECDVDSSGCEDGDCTCPGDVSGPSAVPDDLVSTSDLAAIVGFLGPYSGTSPPYTVAVPPGWECADVSGPSGVPDGMISTSDLAAIVGYLGPYSGTSPPYTAPCIELPL